MAMPNHSRPRVLHEARYPFHSRQRVVELVVETLRERTPVVAGSGAGSVVA